MRWSELPTKRLVVELAKLGIRPRILALDVCDVPELRDACKLLSEKERLPLALEWFGDEGHPQPQERTCWNTIGYTPDWGRLRLLDDAGQPKEKKPRHRPPNPISEETIKQLKWKLAQREARPRDRKFSQEKIAMGLGLDRNRVQQAEALRRVGWDLLRSHPDFSAKARPVEGNLKHRRVRRRLLPPGRVGEASSGAPTDS